MGYDRMLNTKKEVAALEDLVQRDGAGLMAYARSLAGHAQDAEDACQEALSRVLGRRLDRIGNLRAYVYKAVRGAALNGLRAKARRERRERERTAEPQYVFQEPALRREEVDALNRAIAVLPQEQREVVVLKVWGGLSFSQIADVAAIPRDTAASRYRYAMATFKREMKEFFDARR